MAISIPNTINTADYIIYQTGTTIAALNGTTGNVDYQNPDAATLINQTINALSQNGGTIFVKIGTYVLNSSIVLYPSIDFKGSGNATIFKRANNSSINMIRFAQADWNQHCGKVGDFYLDGNYNSGGKGYGIYLGDTARANPNFMTFENIEIVNSDGVGFYHGCYWNTFRNVNIWYSPNYGVNFDIAHDYPNANYYYDSRITGGGEAGRTGTAMGIGANLNGSSNNFINCDFSSWYQAVQGDSAYANTLVCPWFEGNTNSIDSSGITRLTVINATFGGGATETVNEGNPILWLGSSGLKGLYGSQDSTLLEGMLHCPLIDGQEIELRNSTGIIRTTMKQTSSKGYIGLWDAGANAMRYLYINNGNIVVSTTVPT